MIAIGRDEMVYSMQSLGYTTVIALIAILLLLIISFRMWVAPIFAVSNLLVGLIWAIGTAAIVVGELNIMTQMMSVILLGLGIDFSIHIISGFTERRAAGDSIADAMEKTFLKSGKGILTGALTTSCAFLSLVISHSRGMKEVGLVTGTGLLAILFATMLFLPSMLVFRERSIDKKRERKKGIKQIVQRDISFRFLGRTGDWLSKHYSFTILASIIISSFLIWSGSKISFDHNYMNMEPEGLTSITLQDTVQEKFDLSMDYALVLADNVKQSRELSKRYRESGPVAITEDISFYLPSQEQQQKRIPFIREIREKIQSTAIKHDFPVLSRELDRLQMNIMEMQDMAYLGGQDKVDNKCKEIVGAPENPNSRNIISEMLQLLDEDISTAAKGLSKFQQNFAQYFKESVITMSSTESIGQDELPLSILDRYSNKKRDQFLITVFPVSDKATGMPVVFRALIEIIGRDGRNAALLTLVIVFLLLLVDFRNPGHALIAMIPLALGVFWMVGLMHLLGMQLTIMNVMGLPMIIGIGIDYGVHILHRWRHEGRGKIRMVYSSTGKAILLTSLTTMLAFGSLVFSIWRGFGQLGGALFLGVGACFLTTIIILPGIIGMLERRNGKKN